MSQMRSSFCLGVLLDNRGQLDSRCDIVDVSLDMFWDMVPSFISFESLIFVLEQDCLTGHIQSSRRQCSYACAHRTQS